MIKRRVVVSGIGVVSPFGVGVAPFWENIAAGKSGARLIDSFDTINLPTKFAAPLPLSDQELNNHVVDQKTLKTLSRAGKMAVVAAQESIADSEIDFAKENHFRVGTSMGAGGVGLWDSDHSNRLLDVLQSAIERDKGATIKSSSVWNHVLNSIHPLTPLRGLSNVPTAQIAIMASAMGNCQTITTACTSSAQAIGEAYRQIGSDVADIIIAGGSDSMINAYGMVSFNMVGVISKNNENWQTASRPFDRRRDGFMVGEGAVVFILEELEHCRKRNGRAYAEVVGFASTNDAYRLTDEPPEAWGSIQAMQEALRSGGISPEEVDYINAHGTGTKMNDKTETFAIKSVFGDAAYRIPVSSTKSMVGHLVAGAGAIEFGACVLAMEHQLIPPTINYAEPDEECDLDYVPNHARKGELRVILSNSFGFGGQNACLIIRTIESP